MLEDILITCFGICIGLQVTYCPDCSRACKYDTEPVVGEGGIVKGKDFFNYVFGCLFLNETSHVSPL